MAVHVNTTQAQATLRTMARRLSSEQIAKATARAINHTLAKGKTAGAQGITSRYNMPSKGLKQRLPLVKASQRKLSGKVDASTKPIPLLAFRGTKQNSKGVSVAVVKGERKTIRSAFIQTTRKGRKGVFARGQHTSNGFEFRHKRIEKTGPDMPIEELYSVSTFSAGDSVEVQGRISSVVHSSYTSRLIHEMQRIANGSTT
jgi:hypothetical protein